MSKILGVPETNRQPDREKQTMLMHHVDASVRSDRSIRRRDFLRCVPAAAIAAGGLSWSDQMAVHASELPRQKRACILLWMTGGPSQFETLSPLEGHENGGGTKAIQTAVPGIHISEHLPQIADKMDDLAIIRSMTSKEGSHNRASFLLHTGYLPTAVLKYPAFGAVAAQQLGHLDEELPAFVRINGGRKRGAGGGMLGTEYSPFLHSNPNEPPANTQPTTDTNRYRRRLSLLSRLQDQFAETGGATQVETHRKLYEKASQMILSHQMRAFDLSLEPETIRTAYGESEFASGCLLARRLVEAGVTFIEVNCRGWDTHKDNFSKTPQLAAQIDQPMAQLITDLKQRGMLDSTLVVWMGEFGRTPRINARGGRDHFPRAFCAALAGGGIRGGQVIGRVNEQGSEVIERPVTVPDLFQTYCQSLQIDAEHENISSSGRPIKIVTEGQPIAELF